MFACHSNWWCSGYWLRAGCRKKNAKKKQA